MCLVLFVSQNSLSPRSPRPRVQTPITEVAPAMSGCAGLVPEAAAPVLAAPATMAAAGPSKLKVLAPGTGAGGPKPAALILAGTVDFRGNPRPGGPDPRPWPVEVVAVEARIALQLRCVSCWSSSVVVVVVVVVILIVAPAAFFPLSSETVSGRKLVRTNFFFSRRFRSGDLGFGSFFRTTFHVSAAHKTHEQRQRQQATPVIECSRVASKTFSSPTAKTFSLFRTKLNLKALNILPSRESKEKPPSSYF